jgi:hypothetical protein
MTQPVIPFGEPHRRTIAEFAEYYHCTVTTSAFQVQKSQKLRQCHFGLDDATAARHSFQTFELMSQRQHLKLLGRPIAERRAQGQEQRHNDRSHCGTLFADAGKVNVLRRTKFLVGTAACDGLDAEDAASGTSRRRYRVCRSVPSQLIENAL